MDESKSPFAPIPGETPIADLSELKVKGIRYRSELNKVEAANIAKVLARYFGGRLARADAPFTYAWFLQLHREMFEEVWGWAGRLRRSTTNIGVEPRLIEQRLYALSKDLPFWEKEPLILQAVMLHHKAVQIHPFENGNGRWSRTLANIWLHLHEEEPVMWPGTALSEESPVRKEYLQAIHAADLGDYDPLLTLHRRFIAAEEG